MSWGQKPAEFHNRGEAEVVRGEELSVVLRRWVVEWLAERPLNVQDSEISTEDDGAGSASTTHHNIGVHFMGPIQVLAEKTEINTRRVSGIVNGEFKYVSLSQADAVLTAAGLSHMLTYGEISIIPNPGWSPEKWQSYMEERGCC